MKKLLFLLTSLLFTITAYSQNGYSSVFLRVTDSSTFVNSANTLAKHTAGYADIWYSASSGLFWKWNGSAYELLGSGSGGWAVTGTTNLTGTATINGGTNDLEFTNLGQLLIDTDLGVTIDSDDNIFIDSDGASGIELNALAAGGGDVIMTATRAVSMTAIDITLTTQTAGDDITISANDDLVLNSDGLTSITSAEGILLQGSAGSAGQVPISAGAGAPVTWGNQSGSGGDGGVNVFAPNIQTGNYVAAIGDTIRVILMRSASAQNFTIPPDVFPIGTFLQVVQDSTGTTTIVAGSGVSFENPSGTLTLTENTFAVLYQKYANGWIISKGGTEGNGGVNVFEPNIQTGDYTAVVGDTIKVVYMRNVSVPQTFTIPLNDLPVGSFLTVVQDTTAVTTIAGEPGVDIIGTLVLAAKETAVFHQRSSNTWVRLAGVGGGGGGHVIEEEGTPLTQRTKLNFVGGDVTVTDDSGDDATVVTISASGVDYSRASVAISAGTLTLDVNSLTLKNFDLTTTVSSAFTLAFSNAGSFVQGKLTLRVTGSVAITMPSAVIMDLYEESVGRWVSSTNILTLTGTTASPFMMEFYSDGTNIWVSATNRGL